MTRRLEYLQDNCVQPKHVVNAMTWRKISLQYEDEWWSARPCRQGIVKLSDHENKIARLMTFRRRFQTDEIGCRQKLVRAI